MTMLLTLVLLFGVVVGLLLLSVYLIPKLAVRDLRHDERFRGRLDVRTNVIQVAAPIALLLTFMVAILQWQSNQQQSADQQSLAQRGQMADRFAKAIDQLGSLDPQGQAGSNVDIRLGGIYDLESIANDAWESGPKGNLLRRETYEVLSAYVRRHAVHFSVSCPTRAAWEPPDLQISGPEIQAAMTVLGRRKIAIGDPALNLSHIDLRSANLDQGNFQRTSFFGSCLNGTTMQQAKFGCADFRAAHLEGVFIAGSHFQHADFSGAFLDGTRALMDAKLEDAAADGSTVWPAGFDWKVAGVRPNTKPLLGCGTP
jgi:hypothetical protein